MLNADPRVRMSLVRARRNPIMGAVVVADVVLNDPDATHAEGAADAIKSELLQACRLALAAHKVPGHAAARAHARAHCRRQTGAARCITSSLRAQAADWALRSPALSRPGLSGHRHRAQPQCGARRPRAEAASDCARGSIEYRACDLVRPRAPRPLRARVARGFRSDIRTREQCRHRHRRRARHDARCGYRAADPAEHTLADSADQICAALDDERAPGPHREYLIDRRGDRLHGLSVYSATKSSLVGFTRSLAREVGSLGITVNAIAPGFINTEMTHELTASQREQIARRSALGRMAEAVDVARSVEFLFGESGRNITGTCSRSTPVTRRSGAALKTHAPRCDRLMTLPIERHIGARARVVEEERIGHLCRIVAVAHELQLARFEGCRSDRARAQAAETRGVHRQAVAQRRARGTARHRNAHRRRARPYRPAPRYRARRPRKRRRRGRAVRPSMRSRPPQSRRSRPSSEKSRPGGPRSSKSPRHRAA